jgi:hypothetical protein
MSETARGKQREFQPREVLEEESYHEEGKEGKKLERTRSSRRFSKEAGRRVKIAALKNSGASTVASDVKHGSLGMGTSINMGGGSSIRGPAPPLGTSSLRYAYDRQHLQLASGNEPSPIDLKLLSAHRFPITRSLPASASFSSSRQSSSRKVSCPPPRPSSPIDHHPDLTSHTRRIVSQPIVLSNALPPVEPSSSSALRSKPKPKEQNRIPSAHTPPYDPPSHRRSPSSSSSPQLPAHQPKHPIANRPATALPQQQQPKETQHHHQPLQSLSESKPTQQHLYPTPRHPSAATTHSSSTRTAGISPMSTRIPSYSTAPSSHEPHPTPPTSAEVSSPPIERGVRKSNHPIYSPFYTAHLPPSFQPLKHGSVSILSSSFPSSSSKYSYPIVRLLLRGERWDLAGDGSQLEYWPSSEKLESGGPSACFPLPSATPFSSKLPKEHLKRLKFLSRWIASERERHIFVRPSFLPCPLSCKGLALSCCTISRYGPLVAVNPLHPLTLAPAFLPPLNPLQPPEPLPNTPHPPSPFLFLQDSSSPFFYPPRDNFPLLYSHPNPQRLYPRRPRLDEEDSPRCGSRSSPESEGQRSERSGGELRGRCVDGCRQRR